MSKYGFDELGSRLKIAADETNDRYDHDELHAAAEVANMLAGNEFDAHYVERWIDELVLKFEV